MTARVCGRLAAFPAAAASLVLVYFLAASGRGGDDVPWSDVVTSASSLAAAAVSSDIDASGGVIAASPSSSPSADVSDRWEDDDPHLLDGCRHVYLDVGSNVGIQVRKLYEPHLYPDSPAQRIFGRLFGNESARDLSSVCSVGFEPNPSRARRLEKLQEAYNACGWRVKFYTSTAVADHDGTAVYYTDFNRKKLEWGGSIVRYTAKLKEKTEVRLKRLSTFVKNVVSTRRIPRRPLPPSSSVSKLSPSVLMKMDIEGSELEVLADLIEAGSMNGVVGTFTIEFHGKVIKDRKRRMGIAALRKRLMELEERTKAFELVDLDDETYGNSNFPLPKCDLK